MGRAGDSLIFTAKFYADVVQESDTAGEGAHEAQSAIGFDRI